MAGSPSSWEGRVPGALGGSAALPTPSLQAPRGVLTVRRCLSGLPRHPACGTCPAAWGPVCVHWGSHTPPRHGRQPRVLAACLRAHLVSTRDSGASVLEV